MPEEQELSTAAFSLLSDQPSAQGADLLGFDEIAGELVQLVLRSRASTPFALGIEGAWGSGKSTLMERLRRRLEAHPSVTTVTFNAWTAAQDDVAEGLVKTVLDKLDRSAVRRALRNEQLVGWVRVAVNVAAGWLHLGSVVDLFWSETAIDPQTRNKMRQLVEQVVAEWASKRTTSLGEARLLCVVIDDLDRCSPRAAMEVLEAVKLYLNVPGVVFVIGYDQTIVSDLVLQERGYSEAIKGHDYLEKFIQIKYRIPRPAMERSRMLVRALLEASGTHHLFGDEQLDLLVDRNASNPRRIKRFINDFVLAYGMDPAWREFEPATLIQVQLLNAYFEEFGRLLSTQETPDPLEEFAEYRAARESLRRVESTGAAATAPIAFERHRLPLPDTVQPGDVPRLLRALEDELPVTFPRLVDDRELCALVESLGGAQDWDALRRRLLGRELVLEARPAEEGRAGHDERVRRLDGLSVLWVDDRHDGNVRLVQELHRLGAEVELARDTESAAASLARRRFDAFVSDIDREGAEDTGFEALARFRAEGVAPPTVVFFAARVTGSRATRARELGVAITDSASELIAELTAAAARTQPRRWPIVFGVLGLADDHLLVERLQRDLTGMVAGAFAATPLDGTEVPFGDVLLVPVGGGWEGASASERLRLSERVRAFSNTGGPVVFAVSRLGGDEVVDSLEPIVHPRSQAWVSLDDETWEADVAQLGRAAEALVETVRSRGPSAPHPRRA